MGYRSAVQRSPVQSPALDAIDKVTYMWQGKPVSTSFHMQLTAEFPHFALGEIKDLRMRSDLHGSARAAR